MVTQDGVFQIIDVSQGGFCFKCPPQANVLDRWISDILTPIGDLKEYLAEKMWVTTYDDGGSHIQLLMNVGVRFGQLTKDQHSHLTKLLSSFSELPTDWKIEKGNVL